MPAQRPAFGLRADGAQIVDSAGRPVRLLGVTRSGTEYACIQGDGIFEGPHDAASVRAVAAWPINTVRVPLNEDCWLGLGKVAPRYARATYQRAIADYVALLNEAGLNVILDLHWSGGGGLAATELRPMPNREHTPAFWREVAEAYKGNTSVAFELFQEPFPDDDRDTPAAWACWRDGGRCPGVPYEAAGMRELVDAVRDTGATNLILLGGVRYANALGSWLDYVPRDPLHNIAASWHVYDYSECVTPACYEATAGRVIAAGYPLVATEIGQTDCGHDFIEPLMAWLDARGQGYLAWAWNIEETCADGPQLISDYNGTPTDSYGRAFRDHLARLAGTLPSPVGPPSTPQRPSGNLP